MVDLKFKPLEGAKWLLVSGKPGVDPFKAVPEADGSFVVDLSDSPVGGPYTLVVIAQNGFAPCDSDPFNFKFEVPGKLAVPDGQLDSE